MNRYVWTLRYAGWSHFAFHVWWHKKVVLVKRMLKQFESEFNMPASMFCGHLHFFEKLWSHGHHYLKGQPPHWPFKSLSTIVAHSFGASLHCPIGLDHDPCHLAECYKVWEPNGLAAGLDKFPRPSYIHVPVQISHCLLVLLACHERSISKQWPCMHSLWQHTMGFHSSS